MATLDKEVTILADRVAVIPQGISASPYFSPAIREGQLLFISGQAAFDNQGNIVGVGDCARQAEFVFERMKSILEASGAGLGNVAKTTTFLTDPANYAAFNQVRSRYFPQDPPASSTVITSLLRPEMLIEVEAIAVIPA